MAPPVVLVTGCSQGGLGFALAEEFNSRGCITYASARSLEKLRTLPQAIRRLPIDVTDDHSVSIAISTIIREQGQIDVLLNNAGIGNMGPILDVPLSQVEDAYKTNVFGILRMCKAVVPHMASRRSGLVVNIGSVMGVFPTPWSGIYASSKAAVHSLSQTLAMELKPFNVRVMLVAPGAVKTQFANEAAQAFEQPPGSLYRDYLESIIRRINASHEPHALSSHEFAKGVVDKALRTSPPFFLSFAPPAFTWKIFSWLPTALVRYLLTRNFMTLSKKIKDA